MTINKVSISIVALSTFCLAFLVSSLGVLFHAESKATVLKTLLFTFQKSKTMTQMEPLSTFCAFVWCPHYHRKVTFEGAYKAIKSNPPAQCRYTIKMFDEKNIAVHEALSMSHAFMVSPLRESFDVNEGYCCDRSSFRIQCIQMVSPLCEFFDVK